MIQDMVLVKKMGAIVATAAEAVLPQLQSADAAITGVNYLYGSLEEIRRSLLEMSRNAETQPAMYPLVMLLTDISTSESKGGYPGNVTLQMAIVHPAKKESRPEESYTDVIEPVLGPIHDSLLAAIVDSGCFVVNSVRQLSYTRQDVLNMKIAQLADGSFDRVDGIELQNLKLTMGDRDRLTPINQVQGFSQD